MKRISYKILTAEINHGTEENPNIELVFTSTGFICSDANLKANEEIAKREAYNGEYTIEDDGQPEPVVKPS